MTPDGDGITKMVAGGKLTSPPQYPSLLMYYQFAAFWNLNNNIVGQLYKEMRDKPGMVVMIDAVGQDNTPKAIIALNIPADQYANPFASVTDFGSCSAVFDKSILKLQCVDNYSNCHQSNADQNRFLVANSFCGCQCSEEGGSCSAKFSFWHMDCGHDITNNCPGGWEAHTELSGFECSCNCRKPNGAPRVYGCEYGRDDICP